MKEKISKLYKKIKRKKSEEETRRSKIITYLVILLVMFSISVIAILFGLVKNKNEEIFIPPQRGSNSSTVNSIMQKEEKITLSSIGRECSINEEFEVYYETLNSSEVYFETSDDSVVIVDNSGRCIAVGSGEAQITVYVKENTEIKAHYFVYVLDEENPDYPTQH